jgi:hypothetical protein
MINEYDSGTRPRLIRTTLLAILLVIVMYRIFHIFPSPRPEGAPVFVISRDLQGSFNSLCDSPLFIGVIGELEADPKLPQIQVNYCGCEMNIAGEFQPYNHRICICKDLNLGSFDERDTLAHEVRHVYQSATGIMECDIWDDFKSYSERPCERDAEDFARHVLSELSVKKHLLGKEMPRMGRPGPR